VKRTNELVVESTIVGVIFVLTVIGGSLAGLGVPRGSTILSNPDAVAATHNPDALSLYYNETLSSLGEGEFANVSQLLRTFPFVNVSPKVNQTALLANSEMAAINVSASGATLNLNASGQQIFAHDLANASALAKSGCAQAAAASGTFAEFVNSTSPALSSLGVPAQPYATGKGLAQKEIDSLGSECQSLLDLLSHPSVNLTIASSQSTIATGGPVSLNATLESGGVGILGQSVLLYLNGSNIGTVTTGLDGRAQATLFIPYVYKPLGVITAIASANDSISLQRVASNSLDFAILFTATKIVVGDPPVQFPTFSFVVRGNLTTTSGTPLPATLVKITFFNETSYSTTSPTGAFAVDLTVPADAPDGIADVNVAFTPQGTYGPSMNLTSIEVAHLPLKVTLEVPKLSLAGLTTTVSGELTANGTGVPDATVIVGSPWGQFQTQSDRTGRYAVALPVSISEFALTQGLRVSVTPSQAYIAPGQATSVIPLLNPLLIILPALGVGVTAYEFETLGLVPRLRRSAKSEITTEGTFAAPSPSLLVPTIESSGIILAYQQAVALARRKLGIGFKESATMKEMINEVERTQDAGAGIFSSILDAAEDFLYARSFDPARVGEAEENLTKLKELWGG
jgi:hypothetical protein